MVTINKKDERIIWGDVESNGLDENKNKLLQVAFVITDGDYNVVSDLFERKVFYSEEEVAYLFNETIPFVQDMHTATGLWQLLPVEGVPLDVIDQELLEFFSKHISESGTARLGGNSITLDRNFLRNYLPNSFPYMSYRSYDMTSIDGFLRAHFGDLVPAKPSLATDKAHNALDDIMASIDQAKMLRDFILSVEKGNK